MLTSLYAIALGMALQSWGWWVLVILISQLIPLFLWVYLFQKKKKKITKNQVNWFSLICLLWYLLPIFSQILYHIAKYISELILGDQWENLLSNSLQTYAWGSFILIPIVLFFTIIVAFVFLANFLQKKYKLMKDKKNWIEIEEERVKTIENLKIFMLNLFSSPLLVALVITVEMLLIALMKSMK